MNMASNSKLQRYFFICKNMPKESFFLDIDLSDLQNSVQWICAKAKDQYNSKQSEYQIELNIEYIFDNLGYFDCQQSLEETKISQIFYFNAIARHDGFQLRYQYQKDQKSVKASLVLKKDANVSDLRLEIANSLQTTIELISLHHQGKYENIFQNQNILLIDNKQLLLELGITDDSIKNIIRVVQLIPANLIPCQSYDIYKQFINLKQKIYLDPFQSIKAQISQIKNVEQQDFIILSQNNRIISHVDTIKESDIIIFRSINHGENELKLIFIDEEDLNDHSQDNDFDDSNKELMIKVYNDDNMDLIKTIASQKSNNPYIKSFVKLNMEQIKGKTLFKDLNIFNCSPQLYAVCAYHGEIAIVCRREVIPLKIDFRETIFGLKNILENKLEIDSSDQLIYFSGNLLEDSKKLIDYKICIGSRISVEENIFKESLRNKMYKQENSNLEASKSNSINLLYKIKQTGSRQLSSPDSDSEDMLGEGLNVVCQCINQYCKRNYKDSEIIYVKGLGNHLIKINKDGNLETQKQIQNQFIQKIKYQLILNSCKRCLGPVKMLSIIFKDCSIIFIEQTNNQKLYHFKWLSFSPLNISEFNSYSPESHSLYFFVRDSQQNSSEKNQSLMNCLICRKNELCCNDIKSFVHEQCQQQFSLNLNEIFSESIQI